MVWIVCILAVAIAAWLAGVRPAFFTALALPVVLLIALPLVFRTALDPVPLLMLGGLLYGGACGLVIQLRARLERAERQAQEGRARVEAARIEAIKRISSGLAHELRNPLGVIRNAAYLLRKRLSKFDVKPDLLDMIDEEVRSADAMITALSESIGVRNPEHVHADPAALAREALARAATGAGLQTSVDIAPEMSTIWCDAGQMQQVLELLVQNSAEAMQSKGRIEITARRHADFDIFEVRDSGPGIPAANVPDVFEPLYTTKRGRSGLGLARCRQILERHGGRIEALPGEAGGCAIRVSLPRKGGLAAAAATTDVPSRPAIFPREKLVS